MKKAFYIAGLLASLCLFFTACGGGGSPKKISRMFYSALAKGNMKVMKKITTGSLTQEFIEGAEQAKKMKVSISKWKIKEIKDVSENKKTVRVEYVSKVKIKIGKGFTHKTKQDQILHFIKVKKRWLIENVSQASPPVPIK